MKSGWLLLLNRHKGVIITDVTGVIQYVNPAEEAISGYCRDELIGQGANLFKSDKHSEGFFTNMWETINSGKVWSGRFINRRKDGTEYHEDNSISPMYNKSGELTNFVAVKHNVTARASRTAIPGPEDGGHRNACWRICS
jgi:two-component system, cell cycle sensor histidine kinase and response regulator CckA